MGDFYKQDWVYAHSRLAGSIIRTEDGEPFEVECVTEGGMVKGSTIHSANVRRGINCKLDSIDVTPVKLGFVNFRGDTFYLVRKPKRQDWRQGMRYENITSLCGINPRNIPMNYIRLTILNKFPSLGKCKQRVKEPGCKSRAWHRDWAIDKDDNILYRGKNVVGKFIDGKPTLNKEYNYLKEYLQEVT